MAKLVGTYNLSDIGNTKKKEEEKTAAIPVQAAQSAAGSPKLIGTYSLNDFGIRSTAQPKARQYVLTGNNLVDQRNALRISEGLEPVYMDLNDKRNQLRLDAGKDVSRNVTKETQQALSSIDTRIGEIDRQIADLTAEGMRQGRLEQTYGEHERANDIAEISRQIEALKTEKQQREATRTFARQNGDYYNIIAMGAKDLFEELYNIDYDLRTARADMDQAGRGTDANDRDAARARGTEIAQKEARAAELKKQIAALGLDTDRYYNSYKTSRNTQEAQELENTISEYAKEHPVIASAVNIATAPVRGASAAMGMLMDPDAVNSPYQAFNKISKGVNEGVSEKINENMTAWAKEKGWSDTSAKYLGKAGNIMYSAVSSSLESLLTMTAGGAFGELLMGLNAATQTYDDARNNGLDNTHALVSSISAGIFEALFEHLSLEKLRALQASGAPGLKTAILNVLKQFGTEGSEEAFTDIANGLFDYLYNGGMSDYERSVQEYVDNGMSREKAQKQAAIDFGLQVGESFIVGGLSGAMSAGKIQTSKVVSEAVENYGIGKRVQKEAKAGGTSVQDVLSPLAGQLDSESKGSRMLAAVNEKSKPGKIGKAATQAMYEMREANRETIAEAFRASGMESEKAGKAAEMYNKFINKEALTGEEWKLFTDGDVQDVIAELVKEGSTLANRQAAYKEFEQNVLDAVRRNAPGRKVAEKLEKQFGDGEVVKAVKTGDILKASDKALKNDRIDEDLVNTTEVKTADGKAQARQIAGLTDGDLDVVVDESGATEKLENINFGEDEAALKTKAAYIMLRDMMAGKEDFKTPLNATAANLALALWQNADAATNEKVSQASFLRQFYSAYVAGTILAKNRSYDENLYKVDEGYTISDAVLDAAYKAGAMHYEMKPGVTNVSRNMLDSKQKAQLAILDMIGQRYNLPIFVFSELSEREQDEEGRDMRVRLYGKSDENHIAVALQAGEDQNMILLTAGHELFHWLGKQGETGAYAQNELKRLVIEHLKNSGKYDYEAIYDQRARLYENADRDYVEEEIAAQYFGTLWMEKGFQNKVAREDMNLAERIIDHLKQFFKDVKETIEAFAKKTNDKTVLAALQADAEEADAQLELFENVLENIGREHQIGPQETESDVGDGVVYNEEGDFVAPDYSRMTYEASDYVQDRERMIRKIVDRVEGCTEEQARKWLESIDSVSAMIANNQAALDYDQTYDDNTALKSNSEYKWTLDFSTLCAKRLLFTGTFDEIQKALPDHAFTSEEIVELRKMMQEKGYQVACGICYVESTRREMGPITEEFIERYKEAQRTGKPISRINSEGEEVTLRRKVKKGVYEELYAEEGWTPTLGDLNTTDIDLVRRNHRGTYDAYIAYMNARGQAKPKLLETRTAYKGEILRSFNNKRTVAARNRAGGLRIQSFSDFEIVHLIDMMQVVMDMSVVGLKGQAYTKVPAFAEAMGLTGMKINLSLIAKGSGLDADGNLIFDGVEGMDADTAFKLREKFGKNVGTILVGKNYAHIRAALADPRIDFVIPFHKSSWRADLYENLGLRGYEDYTEWQNEKALKKDGTESDRKIRNIDPMSYWEFDKDGEYNAQKYLRLCEEQNRRPKFPQFKDEPGYWKLLIDFKMYDNDGNGAEQETVKPIFDDAVTMRLLEEYKETSPGYHNQFPVAKDIVDAFVKTTRAREMKRQTEGLGAGIRLNRAGVSQSRVMDEYNKPITKTDVNDLRNAIKTQKSANQFTQKEIEATVKWAYKYYKQLGIKSPFFRAWFGDWRAHDNTPVQRANKKGSAKGRVKNDDTGWSIGVSGKVFHESRHQAKGNQSALPYLANIEDIVKKAVLLDTQTMAAGDEKSENSIFMHSMYAIADIGYGQELLKLYVDEMYDPNAVDSNFRSYQLQNIERKQSGVQGSQNTANLITQTASINTVADLYALVKQKDPYFIAGAEIDSAMLNADGTPRVFYHQTMEDFYAFDTGREGAGYYDNEMPSGIFMKETDETIKLGLDYENSRQMALYAAIRNPLVLRNREQASDFWSKNVKGYAALQKKIEETDAKYKALEKQIDDELFLMDEKDENGNDPWEIATDEMFDAWEKEENPIRREMKEKIDAWLAASDYDGVILEQDKGTGGTVKTYVALKANQVKSAATGTEAENIGTFSKYENDIRQSRVLNQNAVEYVNRITNGSRQYDEITELLGELAADTYEEGKARLTPAKLTELAKKYNLTGMDRKDLQAFAERLGKADAMLGDGENADTVLYGLYRIMREQVINAGHYEDTVMDNVKEFRREFRVNGHAINLYIPADVQTDVAEYYGGKAALRRTMFGKMNIVYDQSKANSSLDEFYQELLAKNYGLEETTDPTTQLNNLLGLYSADTRVWMNDTEGLGLAGESVEEIATDKAVQLMTDMLTAGRKSASVKENAARIDKLLTKEQQNRAEGISSVITKADERLQKRLAALEQSELDTIEIERERERLKAENRLQTIREAYRQRLVQEQRRYAEEKQKEALAKDVKRNLKALSDRFLKESDALHVPEDLKKSVMEFVRMFDMDRTMLTANAMYNLNRIAGRLTQSRQDETEGETQAGDEDLMGRFDADIRADIEELAHAVSVIENERSGRKIYTSMLTLDEMRKLSNIMEHIRFLVESANEAFINGKKQKVSALSDKLIDDLKGKHPKLVQRLATVDGFINNKMLTPVYFFREKIGSTMREIYDDFRDGQDEWYRRVAEGGKMLHDAKEKYHYKNWKDDKKHFHLDATLEQDAWDVDLSVEAIMQIYVTAKREVAAGMDSKHLMTGGIVLADEAKLKSKREKLAAWLKNAKNAKGLTAKGLQAEIERQAEAFEKEQNAERRQITLGKLIEIGDMLTDEQKAYADAVVKFMSTTCSDWGNGATMQLSGIKKFTEQYYFPFQSAKNYLHTSLGVMDDTRLKNAGFTKRTVHGAASPLVISGFTDVAASHIEQMALFSTMTVPLDNLSRVYNYQATSIDEQGNITKAAGNVKTAIQNAYGKAALDYINTFVRGVNGGLRSNSLDNMWNKATSMFKRAAVTGNASVVIQQPTSLMRAMALINPRYFLGVPRIGDYKNMMEHAPVAGIKKMGGFDTNTGRSAVDFMIDEQTTLQKATEWLNIGAEAADMVTWTNIWNAVRRETSHEHPDLEYGSDAYYKQCYARFRDIIDYTQVYDSTLSKSELMRDPGGLTKMITAFMAEPTLSFNMLTQSGMHRNGRTVNKGAAIVAFLFNIAVNSAFQSVVGAWRDKDEDETYREKWLKRFFGNLVGDKNVKFLDGAWSPLTMLPWVKDMISIAQGYDVDRSDISVFSDLFDTWQDFWEKMADGEALTLEDYKEIVGTVSQLTPVPLTKIIQDGFGIWNTADAWIHSGMQNTRETAVQAILDGLGYSKGNAEKAYDAMVNNNEEYIRRKLAVPDEEVQAYIDKGYSEGNARTNAQVDRETKLLNLEIAGVVAMDERAKAAAEARYARDHRTYENLIDAMEDDGIDRNAALGAVDRLFKALFPEEDEAKELKDKKLYTTKDLDLAMEAVSKSDYNYIADALGYDEKKREQKAKDYAKEVYMETADYNKAKYILNDLANMSDTEAEENLDLWKWQALHGDSELTASKIKIYEETAKPANMTLETFEGFVDKVKDISGDDKQARIIALIKNTVPDAKNRKARLALWLAAGYKETTFGKYF